MKRRLLLLCCLLSLLSSAARADVWFHSRMKAKPAAAALQTGPGNFLTVALGKTIPPEDLQPPKTDFRLGAGDKLDIELLQAADTRQVCPVLPDGMLYYHILAGIKAEGMTVPELKTAIETGLKEFYKSPQVSITLRHIESQRVWVLGRVNTPGLFPLDKPMTVIEAITRAGGLFSSRFSGSTEELADLRHSFLVRNGEFMPVDFYKLLREGDLSQNVYLQNGDYLYLPSSLAQEVYVLGAVKSPQAVGFSDQVTIISAIANAKGLMPNAYAQRAVIIRGSLNTPQVATVNIRDILAGKAPNIVLEPRDIVWVPNSPWERLGDFTKLVVSTFVRTVAANEGARAASPNALPVQSNLSLNPATH